MAALMAVLAVSACSDGPSGPGQDSAELRKAPVSVDIDGRSLSLDAYLWRDFMPITPPNGRPLMAVVRIRTDGLPLPDQLTATGVWLIREHQMWMTPALETTHHPGAEPPYLEVVARHGPKWDVGVSVDVVVRLRDSHGGIYLLRTPDRIIERTD